MIRIAKNEDAKSICKIYNPYILNTCYTFEEEIVTEEAIKERIDNGIWFVYVEDGTVLGYTYGTTWKPRSAYKYTLETSVYVSEASLGKGISYKLYNALFEELKIQGIHNVIATISLPNIPSINFHKKMGFEKIGEAKEIAYKFGHWINVCYWQKKL